MYDNALCLFVVIPIPGTGVWSDSLAAVHLDMRLKWAFSDTKPIILTSKKRWIF